MNVTASRGRSGVTHCGCWTPNVPDDWWATRLVCNKAPGHVRPHRNGEWEWWGDEKPRRRRHD